MQTTRYLLRFDDLCPTMNWRVWEKIESALVQRHLQPMLAVVPNNQDPVLQVDAPANDFWNRVREWQDRGWIIALHGFQHRYVSRNAGLVATRKKSEFAGLPAAVQREKLKRGVEIFGREGITPRVWIAPGNTFDATTVSLLPEFGIRTICDGCFRFPFVDRQNVTWVPQQIFGFRPAPPGVWTVCYHHNDWTTAQTRRFSEDLDHFGANIGSLDELLEERLPRDPKWSAWLCTHPRFSRLLIRVELKLWSRLAGRKSFPTADMNIIQLPR